MSSSRTTKVTDVATHESATLIAASKVKGTSVYNAAGESIGSIDDVLINKLSGHVAYAVLSFGGFLGIGEKHHPLPWNQLKYSEQFGGYVVSLDKKRLEGAPSYGTSDVPDWNSTEYTGGIDRYYGPGTV